MKTIDKYAFGDIILADYQFSDGKWSKLRPVLVLFKDGQDYTVMKMTSQETTNDAMTIKIDPDVNNNVKITTYVKIKKINTFHETLFMKRIGEINSAQKKHIKQGLIRFIDAL